MYIELFNIEKHYSEGQKLVMRRIKAKIEVRKEKYRIINMYVEMTKTCTFLT